jgi:hypothetical protein
LCPLWGAGAASAQLKAVHAGVQPVLVSTLPHTVPLGMRKRTARPVIWTAGRVDFSALQQRLGAGARNRPGLAGETPASSTPPWPALFRHVMELRIRTTAQLLHRLDAHAAPDLDGARARSIPWSGSSSSTAFAAESLPEMNVFRNLSCWGSDPPGFRPTR